MAIICINARCLGCHNQNLPIPFIDISRHLTSKCHYSKIRGQRLLSLKKRILPSFSNTPEKSRGPPLGEKSMMMALSPTTTAGRTYSFGSPLPPPPNT
mmetsp:Transcript_7532/g.16713  ORF Transcript_7532/g.16713 Transcript_7532/m.16713 type:complete len:98 (+) Transcript_7532:360-653(+)